MKVLRIQPVGVEEPLAGGQHCCARCNEVEYVSSMRSINKSSIVVELRFFPSHHSSRAVAQQHCLCAAEKCTAVQCFH